MMAIIGRLVGIPKAMDKPNCHDYSAFLWLLMVSPSLLQAHQLRIGPSQHSPIDPYPQQPVTHDYVGNDKVTYLIDSILIDLEFVNDPCYLHLL